MDELQISGKRFISSRRIAKDNGYHTDYIGQLIRGGKIKGQKVGRTWYVDEASFAAYLGGGEAAPAAAHIEEPVVEPVREKAIEPVEERIEESEVLVPAPEPVVVAEEIIQEQKAEPVQIKIEKKEIAREAEIPTVIKLHKAAPSSRGLHYLGDEEPLLPEISPKEAMTHVMPASVAEGVPAEINQNAAVRVRRQSGARIIIALAGAGVLVFVFSAVMSSALFQTINVQAGNPASVGYAFHW